MLRREVETEWDRVRKFSSWRGEMTDPTPYIGGRGVSLIIGACICIIVVLACLAAVSLIAGLVGAIMLSGVGGLEPLFGFCALAMGPAAMGVVAGFEARNHIRAVRYLSMVRSRRALEAGNAT